MPFLGHICPESCVRRALDLPMPSMKCSYLLVVTHGPDASKKEYTGKGYLPKTGAIAFVYFVKRWKHVIQIALSKSLIFSPRRGTGHSEVQENPAQFCQFPSAGRQFWRLIMRPPRWTPAGSRNLDGVTFDATKCFQIRTCGGNVRSIYLQNN